MLGALTKLVRWVLQKFAAGVLIVALGLAACGLWLYLKDNVDLDQWRQEVLRSISGERTRERSALEDVNRRLRELSAKIETEQARLRLADKTISGLKDLDSTWNRFFGDRGHREQEARIRERLNAVAGERKNLAADVAQLQEQFTRTTWERDGLEVALGKLDARERSVEAKRSWVVQTAARAWNYPIGRGWLQLPLKAWVAITLGLYFFGPSAGKLVLYFFFAPWIARGRPVRLIDGMTALPEVGESQAAIDVGLRPGERLWIKERFLQASDEGLRRRTRYLLDWRIPLTCVATGLIELIEMTHANQRIAAPAPAGTVRETSEDAGEQRLTLSNQGDPHSELAIVGLPVGASIVLRPSFLAGVIVPEGQRLKLRRHWQIFRWHAWVTLQFRYFEFVGPCRLVVAGSRGVRVENLADRAGAAVPARRTNQDATMGFTPNLNYRPVRAETFWSYFRGMNPLFDDLFEGRGIFLCQQVATEGDAKQARKFWAGVWGGVMKIFGL